ncbi:YkgJ family cysteine cluster protein [Methylovulum psychrotolerans]
METFPCSKCGKCCINLHLAKELSYLNRGDGICVNFDIEANLCRIYDNRPEICRIGLQYEKNYSDQFTWDEFVQLNLSVCNELNQ